MTKNKNRKMTMIRFALMLAVGFTLISAFPSSISAASPSDEPLLVTLFPGRVMEDWEQNPTLFQESDEPLRFFLTAVKPEDRKVDWQALFKAFVVTGWIEDAPLPQEDIALNLHLVDHPRHMWAIVDILSKKGKWPLGYLTLTGSFDKARLEAAGLGNVQLLDSDKQIRLWVRTMSGPEDQRLFLRHQVARFADPDYVEEPDLEKALEAAQHLLEAFPDDVFGHAWAGLILETLDRNLEEALEHYRRTKEAIVSSFPQQPPYWLALQEPGSVEFTDAYKKLRFSKWRGIRGPVQLEAWFTEAIHRLEEKLAT